MALRKALPSALQSYVSLKLTVFLETVTDEGSSESSWRMELKIPVNFGASQHEVY